MSAFDRVKAREVLHHVWRHEMVAEGALARLEECVQPDPIMDRLGDALYEIYVALGEDTDDARNWRELFLPITAPSWSELMAVVVREHVRERDAEGDRADAAEAKLARIAALCDSVDRFPFNAELPVDRIREVLDGEEA